jgi:hypothetical protein
MSFRAKRELLVQVAPRYRAARHGERSAILDEFIAVTRYDRKYAIRVLLGPIQPPAPIRRPRRAYYGRESPGSASQRVVGGKWDLRQAPGAVPGRVDPNARASRPPEPHRRGS